MKIKRVKSRGIAGKKKIMASMELMYFSEESSEGEIMLSGGKPWKTEPFPVIESI